MVVSQARVQEHDVGLGLARLEQRRIGAVGDDHQLEVPLPAQHGRNAIAQQAVVLDH